MMSKNFGLGIDLGTTNSALSVSGEEGLLTISIPQVISPRTVEERVMLPSALYLPDELESSDSAFSLPWQADSAQRVAGEFARERGATVPERLVSSAKSWLSHEGVDRKAPILPWQSEVPGKVSPYEASVAYLRHMRAALVQWAESAGRSLEELLPIATVPASFDEVARSLTHEAAEEAGFKGVTLLEEPLAAFYSWIAGQGDEWRKAIAPGDVVLVCDVGGGTTDFTLVLVGERGGELTLERISVGDHILLGGDNMDLALAYTLSGKLENEGGEVDRWQFLSLVQAARKGKESLLGAEALESYPISVAGRGSSLFASSIATELLRSEVESTVLEGFFPLVAVDQPLRGGQAAGLQEIGLPYASDPAVSRHLSHFLAGSLERVRGGRYNIPPQKLERWERLGFVTPSKVLFNGGVFLAPRLRERVRTILTEWSGHDVKELASFDLHLAVARGAAWYGRMRASGQGLRVKAATLHSYYIGVEAPAPAVPGMAAPLSALCVAPQGMEEGSKAELLRQFGLLTGQRARFRFFSSNTRGGDNIGTLLPTIAGLTEMNTLELELPAAGPKPELTPVTLETVLSEVGTLEIWMREVKREQKHKLEFNLRSKLGERKSSPKGADLGAQPAQIRKAIELVEAFYGKAKNLESDLTPKDLFGELERTLGSSRSDWNVDLCRTLWPSLAKGITKRGRSLAHEVTWLMLAGYLLRPGYGAEMDKYRMAEVWRAWELGLYFPKDSSAEVQWWIMWRRIVGGLSAEQQQTLWNAVWPRLRSGGGTPEMVRLAALMERVPAELRSELAGLLFQRVVERAEESKDEWLWALGRLGSRVPIYGGWEAVLPSEVVERWFEVFREKDWRVQPYSACPSLFSFAARQSGKEGLDVKRDLRREIAQKMRVSGAEDAQVRLVEEFMQVTATEREALLGEDLPTGLKYLEDGDP